jgi:hypothetical protein
MSNNNLSSKVTLNRNYWAAFAPILLLTPLMLAAKGCDAIVIGDDCPDGTTTCVGYAGAGGAAGSGIAGSGIAGSGIAGSGIAGSSSAGSANNGGSANGGVMCGARLGDTCAKDEYCAFAEPGCDFADQSGICQKKPDVCNDIYAPVCGCDGKDYPSECEAAGARVGVLSSGKCVRTQPGTTCGGLVGAACQKGEYCAYPPSAQCGAADQTGSCTAVPGACDAIYQPVCGCDGKTYSSDCTAALASVSVAAVGECPGAGVCGGLIGAQCGKAYFCDYPPTMACGNADGQGQCQPIPNACTKEFAEVCGCDGKLYSNACMANAAGVSVLKTGKCPSN